MTAHAGRRFRLEELPETIPVFPLTGALLLPAGRLPLNVFEPRYLAMVEDTLRTPDRMIGMIQPLEPGGEGMTRGGVVPPPTALYPTGCVGRLTSFTESEDGRYQITLSGLCRFNVAQELPTVRGYRRIVPDFKPWQDDLDNPSGALAQDDRERLLTVLRTYFTSRNIGADWDAIGHTPDDRLVTTLAIACPLAPQEKQALLEARTFADRAKAMIALLEMGSAETGGAGAKH